MTPERAEKLLMAAEERLKIAVRALHYGSFAAVPDNEKRVRRAEQAAERAYFRWLEACNASSDTDGAK